MQTQEREALRYERTRGNKAKKGHEGVKREKKTNKERLLNGHM